jgi:hypothetical protein
MIRDNLIKELIFGDKIDYQIDISLYADNIYKYDDFVEDIKIILKRSGVKIKKSEIIIDSKTAIWYLKVIK